MDPFLIILILIVLVGVGFAARWYQRRSAIQAILDDPDWRPDDDDELPTTLNRDALLRRSDAPLDPQGWDRPRDEPAPDAAEDEAPAPAVLNRDALLKRAGNPAADAPSGSPTTSPQPSEPIQRRPETFDRAALMKRPGKQDSGPSAGSSQPS